jgi:hypothetical protein
MSPARLAVGLDSATPAQAGGFAHVWLNVRASRVKSSSAAMDGPAVRQVFHKGAQSIKRGLKGWHVIFWHLCRIIIINNVHFLALVHLKWPKHTWPVVHRFELG